MKTFNSCLLLALLLAAACTAHGASTERNLLQYGYMPTTTASSSGMMAAGMTMASPMAAPTMAPMMMTPTMAPAPAPEMPAKGVTTAGRKLLAV